MIPWWYTELGEGEKQKLLEAFAEKRITLSSGAREVEECFAKMLNVPYAVVVNSGSAALLVSLLALGIGPGDEVIVPAVTWIATAQAAALLGATVKLCDCTEEAPILDVRHLKSLITPRTKAIIPVHLNGRECDLEAIRNLADRSGIHIVEDACKGMYSRGKSGFLGTIGDLGCYSLGMISLVSVGYGGLIVTRNGSLYEKLRQIRDHGVQRSPEAYAHLGFNFKISDLLTSLAIPQVKALPERAAKACLMHEYYAKRVQNPALSILPIDTRNGKVPVYVEGYSEQREELLAYLQEKGIQTSRYHLPMHKAPYLKVEGNFPHAERFTRCSFILPSGPSQKQEDIERVVEVLNEFAGAAV